MHSPPAPSPPYPMHSPLLPLPLPHAQPPHPFSPAPHAQPPSAPPRVPHAQPPSAPPPCTAPPPLLPRAPCTVPLCPALLPSPQGRRRAALASRHRRGREEPSERSQTLSPMTLFWVLRDRGKAVQRKGSLLAPPDAAGHPFVRVRVLVLLLARRGCDLVEDSRREEPRKKGQRNSYCLYRNPRDAHALNTASGRGRVISKRVRLARPFPPWHPSGRPTLSLLPPCPKLSGQGIKMSAVQSPKPEPGHTRPLQETTLPFAKTAIGTFFQEQPRLRNPYLDDAFLQRYLRTHLPPQVLEQVSPDLERFGARVTAEIDALGRECELNPPTLQPYDAWGRRVDRVVTCPAWKRMKEIAAEEGLVAEAYERRYSSWSRVHQVAKLYLYAPSAGLFTCPLAMTDGAAKVIESLGISRLLANAFGRLTSRDPSTFWTSGQWMTERRGGSDVASGTESVAREQPDGTYSLSGFKWFTSATDSDMTLTLARILDAQGQVEEGSRGLSLFFLEVRDQEGKLNGIEVQRLKEKLGTRQVPTAELLLDGCKAHRISAEGRGVASIANMLTITRLHNVISAVAGMRRVISLAREYAGKRVAFGKLLKDHPLHMQTLARLEVETRGAFLLLMETARLLGLEETKLANEQDLHLLRLLMPVAKLYTGKQAVAVISEGLECFGGQGYMEDTGLPVALRDAQVLTIWEGTTNVLALDVLRSLSKSEGRVLDTYCSAVQGKLQLAASVPGLDSAAPLVRDALHRLGQFARGAGSKGAAAMELAARDFAYSLARIYTGALLLEHAARPDASSADAYAAQRWCSQELCPVHSAEQAGCYDARAASLDSTLVYEKPSLGSKL